jgi:cytoskeletal protein CcmA (bactofilin family)
MRMAAVQPVRIATFFLLVLILLAVTAASGPADERRASLPAGETVAGPYFAYGDLVEISGTVEGDLYAAGGRIFINGTVNGDLLAAGGTVLISGRISQDVRLAGGQVTITGEIGRNLTLAAGQAELTPSARVGGGIVAAGGTIRLAGLVQEGVVLAASQLLIDSRIGGDVQAAVGEVRLSSGAVVKGDLLYRSERQAAIAPQARVAGQTVRRPLPERLRPTSEQFFGLYVGFKLVTLLMNFVSTLILGLLLIHFYPRFCRRTAAQLQERPLSSLGLGFAVLILTPVLTILLALTILGLPLALLLLTWLLPLLYLARIFPIYWLGLVLFTRLNRSHREKLAFAAALFGYSLLTLLPFVSWLLTLFAVLFGVGMILLEKKEVHQDLRAREAL